jgi:hypothetical protein
LFGGCVAIPLYAWHLPKDVTGGELRFEQVGTFDVGVSDVNITLLHRWRNKETGADYYQVSFFRYGHPAGQALVKPADIERYLAGPGAKVDRGWEPPTSPPCSPVTC